MPRTTGLSVAPGVRRSLRGEGSWRRTARVICSQRLCLVEGADNVANVEEVRVHLWPSSLSRPDGRNTCLTMSPLGTHTLALCQPHTHRHAASAVRFSPVTPAWRSYFRDPLCLYTHMHINDKQKAMTLTQHMRTEQWELGNTRFVTEAHANQLFSSGSAPFP